MVISWSYFKTFSFIIHFISFLTIYLYCLRPVFQRHLYGISMLLVVLAYSLDSILCRTHIHSIRGSGRFKIHPNLLFTSESFTLIILIGSLLLMLPNATEEGIDFIIAVFTATSAVCVTGLTVLNASTDFFRAWSVDHLFLIRSEGSVL